MRKATPQRLQFNEQNDDLWFEYHATPTNKSISFRLNGDKSAYRVNPEALQLYFLYRRIIQNSYAEKSRLLPEDIQNWQDAYKAHEKFSGNNLHHYAADACLDAVQEWIKQEKNVQSFMACEQTEFGPKIAGFIHFYSASMKSKQVVYIAQAGAAVRNQKIGTRLMKLVMANCDSNTEFYILTRNFNTEAKFLYGKKLGYESIQDDEIEQLDYSAKKYVGYKHTTSENEIQSYRDEIVVVEDTSDKELQVTSLKMST